MTLHDLLLWAGLAVGGLAVLGIVAAGGMLAWQERKGGSRDAIR